jgi:hypothetical protein
VLVGALRQAHLRLWADGEDAPGRVGPAPTDDRPSPADPPEET